jgi:hypothetical protein
MNIKKSLSKIKTMATLADVNSDYETIFIEKEMETNKTNTQKLK